MRVIFDLESDGLYFETTRIHCIALSIDGGDPKLYVNSRYRNVGRTDGCIEDALEILRNADEVIGHNVFDFDLAVLHKIYGLSIHPLRVFDTLLASRIIYGDSLQSHSLKAWGARLGNSKGTFGEASDWSTYSEEMGQYCCQDVKVTAGVYEVMRGKAPVYLTPSVWDMERKVAYIIAQQKIKGVLFDSAQALNLYAEIQKEYNKHSEEVKSVFPPLCKEKGTMVPKRDNSRLGYKAGVPVTKIEVVEFNPNSRQHIAQSLINKYGWNPTKLTPTGQPQVDEAVLESLPYPEAKSLAWLMLLQKRLGQLYDGDNGWLKCVNKTTGRIHGSVNTNGAVTGRMTHASPNLAQVPSTKHGKDKQILWGAEGGWGAECRRLFGAPKGRKFVGCDASGLELRMLAHYMNDPDYVRELLDGDIHTANQKAAGLETRDQAKTFIYALLYGAGDGKIGSIVGKGPAAGKKLKAKFFGNLPALGRLVQGVTTKAKGGYLRGLDGRILRVRHQHAALNTLLQGAGACVMKTALVILWESADTSRFDFVLNVHDEYQAEVDEDYAEEFARLAEEAIREAGRQLKLRCPLDAEAKIGNNWMETH